jgi:hypothetical protein
VRPERGVLKVFLSGHASACSGAQVSAPRFVWANADPDASERRQQMKDTQILRTVLLVVCAIGVVSLTSCTTTYVGKTNTNRSFKVHYTEFAQINTEPQGCRIYINNNYKGTSPLSLTLNGGTIDVLQLGSYPTKYTDTKRFHPLMLDVLTHQQAETLGETTWERQVCPSFVSAGEWRVVIAADGYKTQTLVIPLDDKNQALKRATAGLSVTDSGKLSGDAIEGRSSHLVVMKPGGSGGTYYPPQGDGGRAAAQAEYDAALQAYNTALKNLNEARTNQDLNRMTPPASGGIGEFVAGAGRFASSQLVRDAEREVEIASVVSRKQM